MTGYRYRFCCGLFGWRRPAVSLFLGWVLLGAAEVDASKRCVANRRDIQPQLIHAASSRLTNDAGFVPRLEALRRRLPEHLAARLVPLWRDKTRAFVRAGAAIGDLRELADPPVTTPELRSLLRRGLKEACAAYGRGDRVGLAAIQERSTRAYLRFKAQTTLGQAGRNSQNDAVLAVLGGLDFRRPEAIRERLRAEHGLNISDLERPLRGAVIRLERRLRLLEQRTSELEAGLPEGTTRDDFPGYSLFEILAQRLVEEAAGLFRGDDRASQRGAMFWVGGGLDSRMARLFYDGIARNEPIFVIDAVAALLRPDDSMGGGSVH